MAKSSGLQGVKGIIEKRGWLYYQAPTPKDGGPRPARVALGTKDLAVAINRMAEIRGAAREYRAEMSGTMEVILPLYYQAKSEDEATTRRNRKSILEMFKEDTGNPRVTAISSTMVDEWRTSLQNREGPGGKPLSGTTIKSYTIALRAFVNWLREEKIIFHDPTSKLKRMTRVATTKRHEFHTETQREQLLADADATTTTRLVMLLGFLTGMRVGEMLALNPAWIWIAPDRSRGSISVQETAITRQDGSRGLWRPKTREIRTIPMHPRVLAHFLEHGVTKPWQVAPQKEFWPNEEGNSKRYDSKKALAGVAKRAGVPKLTFHMMRHTFATHLAMKGIALAEIAGLLGDSLRVTEENYAGFCPNKVNSTAVL